MYRSQYAKKTVLKPLIPVIVGAGGWQWQATVAGMLIAGERYIDFKTREQYDEKFDDLQLQVTNIFSFYRNRQFFFLKRLKSLYVQ